MNTKRKEKLGNFALDTAKYIITAGVVAKLFTKADDWMWYHYVLILIGVFIMIAFGVYWAGGDDNDKKQKG